jgi:hypothetical protein
MQNLLAMAVVQSTVMLNVMASSRASSLPQGPVTYRVRSQASERITSPSQSMNALTRNGKCRCRA